MVNSSPILLPISPTVSTGQSYWVFDAERQITGPDSVHRLGLTVKDIQAALMWGEDKTQKIYFFKSGNYWRFNLLENRIDTTHARSMRDWRGIPNDIDAAFQDRYGTAVTLALSRQSDLNPNRKSDADMFIHMVE